MLTHKVQSVRWNKNILQVVGDFYSVFSHGIQISGNKTGTTIMIVFIFIWCAILYKHWNILKTSTLTHPCCNPPLPAQ